MDEHTGHIHDHDHYDHDHHHDHEHHHDHAEAASREEQLALLTYMIHHNEHHAEELHDLGHSIGGEASEKIHEAVKLLDESNGKLAEALSIMTGET